MNFYPAEVVTPPLALVALLGRPDLHAAAGEFLRSQHKPPINSIGVAEPASAARLFGERERQGASRDRSACSMQMLVGDELAGASPYAVFAVLAAGWYGLELRSLQR